ncbi:MAG: Hpt domain-containing protein [Burkholderiaceae bacterium]
MSDSTIDEAIVRELEATAGKEFVAELATTFMEEAPVMLAQLRAAQTKGDAEEFRRTAHSLKSNSVTFGAMRLGDMARQLEQNRLITDAEPLNALEAEFDLVSTALTEFIRG